MFSMSLIKPICIGGYLIWRFLGPSQISQLKSPPNINRFTVTTLTILVTTRKEENDICHQIYKFQVFVAGG